MGGRAHFLFLQDGVLDIYLLVPEIATLLEAIGLDLYGIEWAGAGAGSTLRVYIEARGREVEIEDCEAASRVLSQWLDHADPIPGRYVLEVSSPGIERPLFTEAHYRRQIGRQISVVLKLPQTGRRRFRGVLTGIEHARVQLDGEGGRIELALDAIQSARLVPDWSALGCVPASRPGRSGPAHAGGSAAGRGAGRDRTQQNDGSGRAQTRGSAT